MATTRIVPQPEDATALVVSVQHTGTRSIQRWLKDQGHIVHRCHVDQEPEPWIERFDTFHVPLRDPAACYESTLKRSNHPPERVLGEVIDRFERLAGLLDLYHNKAQIHRIEGFRYAEGVFHDQPSSPTDDPNVLRHLHGLRCRFGYQESMDGTLRRRT